MLGSHSQYSPRDDQQHPAGKAWEDFTQEMAAPTDPCRTPELRNAMPIKTAKEAIDQPATSAARAIVLEEYK